MPQKAPDGVFRAALALSALLGCHWNANDRATVVGGSAHVASASLVGEGVGEGAGEELVKRYEDERLIGHRALVVASGAAALTSFPKGKVVATFHAGDSVEALAERNGFYRIRFVDATNPSRPRMGWIAKLAFERDRSARQETKGAAPRCLPPQVLVMQDRPRCAYECDTQRECREGSSCEAARVIAASGVVESSTKYTTACTPSRAAVASVPSLFGAPHRMDGSCATGFATAPKLGPLCYRSCKTDAQCPLDATCRPGRGPKLCFVNSQ